MHHALQCLDVCLCDKERDCDDGNILYSYTITKHYTVYTGRQICVCSDDAVWKAETRTRLTTQSSKFCGIQW